MQDDWIKQRLNDAASKGLNREARVHAQIGGVIMHADKRILNFSGNDYLNLSKHPHVIERARTALETYGSGATASISQRHLSLHEELEDRLALQKNILMRSIRFRLSNQPRNHSIS